MARLDLQNYSRRVQEADPVTVYGKVVDVVGLTIEATGPSMKIGDLCYIHTPGVDEHVPVEVVGFRGKRILLMPLGEMHGISPDSLIYPTFKPIEIRVGNELMGRVVDSMGSPMDGGPPLHCEDIVSLTNAAPRPLDRRRIIEPITTGIRSVDLCATCGKGQRVGIFSGSGVGKSKMLGMIARNTNADINVIALIGERGREVKEFIEVDLGPEGLERSIVVVATSDEPSLMRIKGAYVATSIAEWFRAQGADVMLLMDSITRFAMAQREVGLAVGEPPTTKGYPPSVYGILPKLLERAGTSEKGSVTGFYTVLVESDDMTDPIADATRSILDGHIALTRDLASRGHFPAVDVLDSISRVMIDVTNEDHQQLATRVRQILATYHDAEDLVNIGAYVEGSNREIDTALKLMPGLRKFLQQGLYETTPYDEIPALINEVLKG